MTSQPHESEGELAPNPVGRSESSSHPSPDLRARAGESEVADSRSATTRGALEGERGGMDRVLGAQQWAQRSRPNPIKK
eukprot:6412365-Amphidinium_carterae.1